MADTFFSQTNCDRCGGELDTRTMSWFTQECICMTCANDEKDLRNDLPHCGKDYEGCGYIPKVENGEVKNA